ncbi:methyltransferase type 12 [Piscirickettsia litoralis]|uniref:Methyltransferase type 12 n=2 Tax=Piscirickettsia litoralis TaxID=1891921 RepID=A0ABX3A533_9GAMM|nr:methyltransferase type 12 [Piscirickettsia litoralis]
MDELSDLKIIDSWKKNTQPWIKAIENSEIETRQQVTNHVIIKEILASQPKKVLDIGCGEGWLVRTLESAGIDTLGIDAVPEFIEYGQSKKQGRFKLLSFESLTYQALQEKFDIIICNFSLIGKEVVDYLFNKFSELLSQNGRVIIQTLHPVTSCGNLPYQDGWRKGSWQGFSKEFMDPAPWYFRTVEAWQKLFIDNGFSIDKMIEPVYKKIIGLFL